MRSGPMQILEAATVWLEQGVPARLVFRGQRYRILDTPTRLEVDGWVTHLPPVSDGWRLTADDGSGSVVLDLRYDPTACTWLVTAVYA